MSPQFSANDPRREPHRFAAALLCPERVSDGGGMIMGEFLELFPGKWRETGEALVEVTV